MSKPEPKRPPMAEAARKKLAEFARKAGSGCVGCKALRWVTHSLKGRS